jgi:Co/Zn/Cd efflux system component
MHIHSLERWQHSHDFVVIHEKGEKRTKQVLLLTAITMIVEIIAGFAFGSMALLADGWHMGTHSAAFAITIFAYRYSRKHAKDKRFAFGTGKVSVLGGFASAIALAVVALFMAIESMLRFMSPSIIHYNEAIPVALLGLLINIICAVLLYGNHGHTHSEEHGHDHNLKGAYLFFGKYFGWNWLDPSMGIVGALLIARWSYGLLIDTSSILLDKNITMDKTKDMSDYAAMISLVTHYPKKIEYYKELLSKHIKLSHITIEVIYCDEVPCIIPKIT